MKPKKGVVNQDGLNDLQQAYLLSPGVGLYYYSSLAPNVYECVMRITDKFISPISNRLVLEIKEIEWNYHLKETKVKQDYISVEEFDLHDYKPATHTQIQRLQTHELSELKHSVVVKKKNKASGKR